MRWPTIIMLWITFFTVNLTYAGETSKPMVIGGGLICDTLEQAIEQIETTPRMDFVDGCGRLDGRQVATVTPLAPLHHKGYVFPMVRFDFLSPVPWDNQVQYGFWGKPIKKTAETDA